MDILWNILCIIAFHLVIIYLLPSSMNIDKVYIPSKLQKMQFLILNNEYLMLNIKVHRHGLKLYLQRPVYKVCFFLISYWPFKHMVLIDFWFIAERFIAVGALNRKKYIHCKIKSLRLDMNQFISIKLILFDILKEESCRSLE